jgi:uncharacterized membrane protein YgcG
MGDNRTDDHDYDDRDDDQYNNDDSGETTTMDEGSLAIDKYLEPRPMPVSARKEMYAFQRLLSDVKAMMNENKRKLTLARASLPKGKYHSESRHRLQEYSHQYVPGAGSQKAVNRNRRSFLHGMLEQEMDTESFHQKYDPLLKAASAAAHAFLVAVAETGDAFEAELKDLQRVIKAIKIGLSEAAFDRAQKVLLALRAFLAAHDQTSVPLHGTKFKERFKADCTKKLEEDMLFVVNCIGTVEGMHNQYRDKYMWFVACIASAQTKAQAFQTQLDTRISEYEIYQRESAHMAEEDSYGQIMRLKDLHIRLDYDLLEEKHRNNSNTRESSSSSSSTSQPGGGGGSGSSGRAKQATITAFFTPKHVSLAQKLRKEYQAYYYDYVVGYVLDADSEAPPLPNATALIEALVTQYSAKACPDWYAPKVVAASSSSSSSASSTKRKRSSGGPHQSSARAGTRFATDVACTSCGGTAIIIDGVTGYYTCTDCAANFAGSDNMCVGYKCSENFSVKPTAPYERLSHVSYAFNFFICYIGRFLRSKTEQKERKSRVEFS